MSPAALMLLSTATGAFFVLSGYHKLTVPSRHAALVDTLRTDLPRMGLPASGLPLLFMSWWLPAWEFTAGFVAVLSPYWLGLSLLYDVPGLLLVPKLAMVPILAIMASALVCEGMSRVRSYEPIDLGDWIDDWLYLPETLLALMALAVLLG